MRFLSYVAFLLLGFLLGKLFYGKKEKNCQKEEVQLITAQVENLSKLVVTQGTFSEIYSFTDTKKYFYDYFQFEKKAILSVNAKIEIGYDLSKLSIQIDSVGKKIIINKIPDEEINISPEIKYFDLQQSSFNSFSTEELNKLNEKAIKRIENTEEIKSLEKKAKNRLFAELSKIYQLSKVYGWEVVDNTQSDLNNQLQL